MPVAVLGAEAVAVKAPLLMLILTTTTAIIFHLLPIELCADKDAAIIHKIITRKKRLHRLPRLQSHLPPATPSRIPSCDPQPVLRTQISARTVWKLDSSRIYSYTAFIQIYSRREVNSIKNTCASYATSLHPHPHPPSQTRRMSFAEIFIWKKICPI